MTEKRLFLLFASSSIHGEAVLPNTVKGLPEISSERCDAAASSILKFPRDLTIICYFTKETFLFSPITPLV